MKHEVLIPLREVARRYGLSTKTVRRALIRRDGAIVPPAFDRPWRWRESEVDAHIAGNSVTEQRRLRARRLRAIDPPGRTA